MAVLVVVPVLISAPWFWLCWRRYGTPFTTRETYDWSRSAAHATASVLSCGDFLWGMLKSQVAAFAKSFIWSSTRSFVRQPLWHYGLGAALAALAVVNVARRRWKTADADTRRVALLAALWLAPLMLSIVHYMYLKGRYDAFQSNIGGYYLFSAWLPLAVFLGAAFDASASRWGRCLVWAAMGLSLYVELYGLWLLAQVYSGVVQKVGANPAPIGHLWPTPHNLLLVYTRLREIAFPAAAMFCYLVSWFARCLLIDFVVKGRAMGLEMDPQRLIGLERGSQMRPVAETEVGGS
jgi:hypothetical protein